MSTFVAPLPGRPHAPSAWAAWSLESWLTLLAACVRRTTPCEAPPSQLHAVANPQVAQRSVRVSTPAAVLDAVLTLPARARAVVVLLEPSGLASAAPGNRMVATALSAAGYATLSVALLASDETAENCSGLAQGFEFSACTQRAIGVLQWVTKHPSLSQLPLLVFAAGTGAAAALAACAKGVASIRAIACRGGRPELAGGQLAQVRAPTLFLVGENDGALIAMSRGAAATIAHDSRVTLVPGTRNLLADEHAIEPVVHATLDWFAGAVDPTGETSTSGGPQGSLASSAPQPPGR